MTETPARKSIARLPRHVAIIMDGNGRWAKGHGLSRIKGHQAGAERIRPIVRCLSEHKIEYTTLYAFSTENWRRPKSEVAGLFRLLKEGINRNSAELHRNRIRLCHIGRLEGLPRGLQTAIKDALELTRGNTGMTLTFALNYGGRPEIVDAARRLIAAGVTPGEVDEGLFSRYLYTSGLPDVDLLIRTGGEMRLSNFLLWQSAYSELYFTDVLWPDFDETEMEKALTAYGQRQRRFGAL